MYPADITILGGFISPNTTDILGADYDLNDKNLYRRLPEIICFLIGNVK